MQLKQYLAPCSLMLGFMLCAPMAKPGEIDINGTCLAGTCPTDTISDPSVDSGPSSSSGTYNFNVTVNGDIYNVAGAYTASYTEADGVYLASTPVITYTGVTPTAQEDDIKFDFIQNIFDDCGGGGCSAWGDGVTYGESFNLVLTAPGTINGQLLFDNQSIGLSPTFTGPGSFTYSATAPQGYLATDFDNNLLGDLNINIAFAAGTQQGQGGSSPTPEPAMAIPAGLGLVLLAIGARRRNRSRIAA
jgi:hypothetical protein